MDADSRLTALYESTSAEVFAYVCVRAAGADVAEEILAQTYEAAARVLAAEPEERLGLGWLVTVARRRLVDHWRSQEAGRRAAVALRNQVIVGARSADDDTNNIAAEAEAAERQRRIERSLDALSARQRAALTLRYLDELSVSEVAGALDLSYQATESLLARARRSFRSSFGALCAAETGGEHD